MIDNMGLVFEQIVIYLIYLLIQFYFI